MMRTRALRGLVVLVAVSLSSGARAEEPKADAAGARAEEPKADAAAARREPTAGDLATARTALREGLTLREKGDLPAALMRLSSAYDLVPTPVTGFELGKTHLMLGHVLQAHELFKKVVRMPPSMEESTRSEHAREESAKLAAEVEPRIPALKIALKLPKDATCLVRIDDEPIPTLGAETLRAVDPGPHEIYAKAGDGPEEHVHVDIAESEVKSVALAPTWVPPKVPPKSGQEPIFIRTTNPLVYVGFGVAVTSAIVSGITGVVAFLKYRDTLDHCGKDFCPPANGATTNPAKVGDNAFTSDRDAMIVLGAVSAITGVIAVLSAGVGVFGLRQPIKERVVTGAAPRPPSIQPVVRHNGAAIVGTF